jgi:hypothetical protein
MKLLFEVMMRLARSWRRATGRKNKVSFLQAHEQIAQFIDLPQI